MYKVTEHPHGRASVSVEACLTPKPVALLPQQPSTLNISSHFNFSEDGYRAFLCVCLFWVCLACNLQRRNLVLMKFLVIQEARDDWWNEDCLEV